MDILINSTNLILNQHSSTKLRKLENSSINKMMRVRKNDVMSAAKLPSVMSERCKKESPDLESNSLN